MLCVERTRISALRTIVLQPMPRSLQESASPARIHSSISRISGLDGCGKREAQAHHHPCRVDAHRKIEEIPSPANSATSSSNRGRGGPRQAVVQATQHDVLAAGQFQVHAETGVKQCAHGALHPHTADHRLVDATSVRSSVIYRTVRADQPEPVSAAKTEADVAQSLHDNAMLTVLAESTRCSRHHGLFRLRALP